MHLHIRTADKIINYVHTNRSRDGRAKCDLARKSEAASDLVQGSRRSIPSRWSNLWANCVAICHAPRPGLVVTTATYL